MKSKVCPHCGHDMSSEEKDELIDKVIDQIKNDIEHGDLTAITELLGFVDRDFLIGYLPEDIQ